MKQMIIFSDGGLGNRLNSLIGGLVAAEVTQSIPIICWPINNWCGCTFQDLYESQILTVDGDIHSVFLEDDRHYIIHQNQTDKTLKKVSEHSLKKLLSMTDVDEDIVYYHNKLPSYFTSTQIISNLKKFKIQKNILSVVQNFCKSKGIDNNIKGVHLRKTDHGKQLDSNAIFNQIENDLKSKYFVCSDDEATEKEFSRLKNVIVFPKTNYVEKLTAGDWTTKISDTEGRIFPYNVNRSAQSVIQALADLLILSRTNIVVRNKSSFLGWAKIYGQIADLNEFS